MHINLALQLCARMPVVKVRVRTHVCELDSFCFVRVVDSLKDGVNLLARAATTQNPPQPSYTLIDKLQIFI